MSQASQETGAGVVLREKLRRRDLKGWQLRQHCWDQLHPRTGRFRPSRENRYVGCVPWLVSSETFIQHTEHKKLDYQDWVRGTYIAHIPISDGSTDQEGMESQVPIPVTLSLDFTRKGGDFLRWTIDTRDSQIQAPAAYPGIHSGYFSPINLGSYNSVHEVHWDTPIFSPYIEITAFRQDPENEDFKPSVMKTRRWPVSEDILRESGHLEKVIFGDTSSYVNVLQPILRDIARLLVFGPLYENMKVAPVYTYSDLFKSPADWDIMGQRQADFFKSAHFPEAARFFSRVFCQGNLDENESDGDLVQPERCEASVRTILTLFEHFNINREPLWLDSESEDWVDDLEAQAKTIKTVADWKNFEQKWAPVASYACGLNLHQGPWGGKDWQVYIETST